MRKRLLSLALLGAMVLALCACHRQPQQQPAAVETPEANFPVAFCLGAQPDSLDPKEYDILGDATYLVNLCSGLVSYRPDDAGTVRLTADLCAALPTPTQDETGKPVYVFHLRDGLKWSDGSALTAADFVYSWNRVVKDTQASERDLFSCIDGFETGTLNLSASEDGKTFTVVLSKQTPRFLERLANPVFCPVQEKAVQSAGWDTDPERSVTSGAYRLAAISEEGMTLEKNEHYWDAEHTQLDHLDFVFSDDAAAILAGYREGRYRVASGLPAGVTSSLRETEGDALHVTGRMGNYCLCFNVNDPALAEFTEAERTDIRLALNLLIDRETICEQIAKLGQRPATSFVPVGLTDADGTSFSAKNGYDGKGNGYFSAAADDYAANCARAEELLRAAAKSSGKFTVSDDGVCSGFPTLTFLTSESAGHVEIANAITDCFQKHGIELKTTALEMQPFLKARAQGDFSLARFSWMAPYDDPAIFLSLWATGAGSNCIGLGQDAHGEYAGYTAMINGTKTDGLLWSQAYDALLYTIQSSEDAAQRSRCMHEAESLLMSTGAICPIYEYTCVYLCRPSFTGLYTGPSGAMYFMRASA